LSKGRRISANPGKERGYHWCQCTTVLCGVTIGEFAMIGAGAVVTKDVKPFSLMTGVAGEEIGLGQ
jgi:acyl-[acyl carrier protein]--UDP-N-acetylglucosamine O-acyltransferase